MRAAQRQRQAGNDYRHDLPAPETIVSEMSWHEKAELRIRAQLKALEPEASAICEGTLVTRLSTRRQALYQIGAMRYVLDQAVYEIVTRAEKREHE